MPAFQYVRVVWFRALIACLAPLLALAVPSLARANELPPVFASVDSSGVDVGRGVFSFSRKEVSIGPEGAGGLAFVRTYRSDVGWRHSYQAGVKFDFLFDTNATVSIGARSETFAASGASPNLTFSSNQQRGATLEFNEASGIWTYVSDVGVTARFSSAFPDCDGPCVTEMTYPSGEKLTFHYSNSIIGSRLQSVTNNFGY